MAKAPTNRRVKHQHDAMTAAKRGQCRVAAVHMQSAKPTRGSSPVERSHFKRTAAIVHENCQWSAARLAGPVLDERKHLCRVGARVGLSTYQRRKLGLSKGHFTVNESTKNPVGTVVIVDKRHNHFEVPCYDLRPVTRKKRR